jgi:hypothetical protein
MVLGGPVYRDSFNGVQDDFAIDMEPDGTAGDGFTEGWFSEASVQEILWDAFDSTNEPGDTVALGFAPIYAAITSSHVVDTDALTTIYPFIVALRNANPGAAAGIDTLLEGENIFGSDDFGAGESNDGGDAAVLPVYKTIQLNNPTPVCSRSPFGNDSSNKLGNRVLLRFDNNTTRLVTITAAAATNGGGTMAATDPDIFVMRRGTLAALGVEVGSTETISQISLDAGTFIIEVYDARLLQSQPPPGTTPRCMTVSVTGN